MREDREQERHDREQERSEREQLQDQMQQFMTDTLDRLTLNNDRNNGTPNGNTRSKKLDAPILGPVDSTGIADFRTWRETFEGLQMS